MKLSCCNGRRTREEEPPQLVARIWASRSKRDRSIASSIGATQCSGKQKHKVHINKLRRLAEHAARAIGEGEGDTRGTFSALMPAVLGRTSSDPFVGDPFLAGHGITPFYNALSIPREDEAACSYPNAWSPVDLRVCELHVCKAHVPHMEDLEFMYIQVIKLGWWVSYVQKVVRVSPLTSVQFPFFMEYSSVGGSGYCDRCSAQVR